MTEPHHRNEAAEIEVEVVEIDGVAPDPAAAEGLRSSAVDSQTGSVHGAGGGGGADWRQWQQWRGQVRRLDSRWWPLWVFLGIILLALLLTVGLVVGLVVLVLRLFLGIVRAIIR